MFLNLLEKLLKRNNNPQENDIFKTIKSMTNDELNTYRKSIWEKWSGMKNGPEREILWDLMKDVVDKELNKRANAELDAKYPDGIVPGHKPWTDANRWDKD